MHWEQARGDGRCTATRNTPNWVQKRV